MATFPYTPLDLSESSIRLLYIRKGWPGEDIICELCESYLQTEKGIPYKALSYNWGGLQHEPQPGLPLVLVDGHQISLTENLYSALRHIRRPDQNIFLWVDAICINQKDPREKGHQVKQMGYIYKGAEEVLIWLGPGHEGTDTLLQSFSWIDNKATESLASGNKEDWMSLCHQSISQRWPDLSWPKQVLTELLTRPWFKRVWILQEVANARTARVLCGRGSCPARTFALMPSLMKLAVNEHTQAVLDIMPRIRQNTWWSSNRHLHVLLAKFADSQSFLVRDRIYALLGMSEDACNPETFYPCYQKSEEEVIRDTASFLLFRGSLGKYDPMPHLRLSDLCLPITQLAGNVLIWTLEQLEASEPRWASGRETATLLARHLNERRFEPADVLMMVAKKYGEAKRVNDILLDGDTELFFHVVVSIPWRLCVTMVRRQAGPVVSLGHYVLVRYSITPPPREFMESGEDWSPQGWRSTHQAIPEYTPEASPIPI
ncbi:heterokaryon incompatibility protein-domain-containing protein [Chaetomium fimeti]|uniref:Heterokaryon incompatibility protein-domain-containing protein n=1 Tax=Chaetomium fimeti TaxID=1854472 RepID=A0AAE0H9A8_9PEZI|nr:heterokaryon incompatibility protein-domain-containing protein [Chaetomium fimeti]